MEVILMERVERLGQLGQVVKVRPGYARNFLLPQKKALRATKANMEVFEKQRAQFEAHNAKLRADAEDQAKKLQGVTVMLIRQASESGQLFGSVTARDVAEAATDAGHKIERRLIEITTPIKTIGLFPVKAKLHPEVSVSITVNVARTEEEGRLQQERGVAAANAKAKSAAAELPAVDAGMFDAPPAAEAAEGEAEAKPVKKRASKKKAAASEEA
ncbi:MAG: 50S ribosomal protein L9 [Alphaproteobacteria bacterium]